MNKATLRGRGHGCATEVVKLDALRLDGFLGAKIWYEDPKTGKVIRFTDRLDLARTNQDMTVQNANKHYYNTSSEDSFESDTTTENEKTRGKVKSDWVDDMDIW